MLQRKEKEMKDRGRKEKKRCMFNLQEIWKVINHYEDVKMQRDFKVDGSSCRRP